MRSVGHGAHGVAEHPVQHGHGPQVDRPGHDRYWMGNRIIHVDLNEVDAILTRNPSGTPSRGVA